MTADDDKDREPTPPAADAQKGVGVSSQAPAEGADEVSPPTEGSPEG